VNPQRWPSNIVSTGVGVAVLAGVLAAGAALAIAGGGEKPGWGGAVAFAAGVSLIGSVGGWLLARWPTANPASGVAKALGAMTLRMFLPLAALAWLQTEGRELRAAGADRLLLIFYLALLATDILLHIMGGRNPRGIGGKNAVN
jgi:hypothetical protein